MKLATTYRVGKDPTGLRDRYYVPAEFIEVLNKFNVSIIPILSLDVLDEIEKMCDGLILAGSYADTHPHYYNEEPIDGKCYEVDEYAFDSKVLKKFVDAKKPVLGVCGGHQEINVYFGGTLTQHIEGHSIATLHKANLEKDSFLYEVYGKDTIEINSFHHQCIKDVAPGFKITAVSDDGIIEAIEKDNIICVQWHPEVMGDTEFFKHFLQKIK